MRPKGVPLKPLKSACCFQARKKADADDRIGLGYKIDGIAKDATWTLRAGALRVPDYFVANDLVFGALKVAAVFSVDDNPGSNADMRGHHDTDTIVENGRLVRARCRLAFDDRFGFDDFGSDALR